MRKIKFNNGFTIIELLTTVVIAGILLAVALPSFGALIKNNRLTSNTNEFILVLNLARSEAGKRGITVGISATNTSNSSNEWGNGWTVFVDSNGDGTMDTGETQLRIGEAFTDNVTLDGPDGVDVILYKPSGLHGDAPNSVSFPVCDERTGEDGRQITIGITGHVSVDRITCS